MVEYGADLQSVAMVEGVPKRVIHPLTNVSAAISGLWPAGETVDEGEVVSEPLRMWHGCYIVCLCTLDL